MNELIKELEKKAEFWRTTEEDVHGIAMAVYVTLMEVKDAIAAAAANDGQKDQA